MSTRLRDSKKSKKRVLPDTLGVMCNSVTLGNLNQGRVNDISTSLFHFFTTVHSSWIHISCAHDTAQIKKCNSGCTLRRFQFQKSSQITFKAATSRAKFLSCLPGAYKKTDIYRIFGLPKALYGWTVVQNDKFQLRGKHNLQINPMSGSSHLQVFVARLFKRFCRMKKTYAASWLNAFGTQACVSHIRSNILAGPMRGNGN